MRRIALGLLALGLSVFALAAAMPAAAQQPVREAWQLEWGSGGQTVIIEFRPYDLTLGPPLNLTCAWHGNHCDGTNIALVFGNGQADTSYTNVSGTITVEGQSRSITGFRLGHR